MPFFIWLDQMMIIFYMLERIQTFSHNNLLTGISASTVLNFKFFFSITLFSLVQFQNIIWFGAVLHATIPQQFLSNFRTFFTSSVWLLIAVVRHWHPVRFNLTSGAVVFNCLLEKSVFENFESTYFLHKKILPCLIASTLTLKICTEHARDMRSKLFLVLGETVSCEIDGKIQICTQWLTS